MPSYYSLSHNIFLVWDDPAVFVSCGVQEILSSGTTVFCISQLQKTTLRFQLVNMIKNHVYLNFQFVYGKDTQLSKYKITN